MKVTMEENGEIVTLKIEEERLDAHNSNELKIKLLSIFEEGKVKIIIDLTDVRFIDSSGLGALVSGFKNASSRDGVLKLCGLQTQVKSMFELTRLHRVFEIFPNSDEAQASY